MWFLYAVAGLALFAAVLYLLGNYTFWLPLRSAKLPRVVMLHQVTPHAEASGMNMPPAKFEQLLQYLVKKKATFCFVSELDQYQGQRNVFALSFDDGFLDNYQYAYPLLKKYKAKATIYLATQIEGIEKLNAEQIREMSESGVIEFGAHTQHHVNLLKLSDEDAFAEMQASKQDIEALVGRCPSFAYPFGRFNARHQQMAQEIGFKNAVSTRKKVEAYTAENQFNIPRVSTHGAMNALQMRIAMAKGRYKL
ncbi:polysaccharide deacetylase family protein [Acinetobacter bouvetii]|jgi:peptidoglycan/xylan/chitin deacetylase (PgdA/CDA1 family)|uniref:Polysaccharide deacetylase family protein n=2 Tax=Acinetobacter TaxID=469 RepID=A0A4Q7ASN4_9GAMM|nr:polysaccharide deacetylase family protein [Acinetobacter bouvetii]TCB73423.1 polysaccharide deacetylase family protein [Acinetobacter sp. ANC 4177]